MSERIHGLARLLPDKSSLEDYSIEELQHLTKRFPYFAPAQFLLLQKLKESHSHDHDAQQQKAVLYYHDPLLFGFFIAADKFLPDDEQPSSATEDASSPVDEITSFSINQDAEPYPAFSQTKADQLTENGLQPHLQLTTENASPLTEPDTVNTSDQIDVAEPAFLSASPLREDRQPIAEVETGMAATAEQTQSNKDIIVAPSAALVAVEDKSMVVAENKKEDHPVPSAPSGETLLFEPYHTVDYFASQGIKISTEVLPKDKLERQLRSFTEWLKIMKRLPAAEMEATPKTTAERSVESLASHSVQGGDVVTEAMAEVWARQGNKQKAMETYNKLSLLNPSKKAYFAAKIENLSGT